MVLPSPAAVPQVHLRWGGASIPAVPLLLRGHDASLAIPCLPPALSNLSVVLLWSGGATTVLDARLLRLAESGRVAELEFRSVSGAWQPWVDFLGRSLPPTPSPAA